MMPAVKFCGLMRREDAEWAVAVGARYLGVIFAGGPRRVAPAVAEQVLSVAPPGVERVGVFGAASPDDIADTARVAALDIVQLHTMLDTAVIPAIRARTGCKVWGVVRVAGATLPPVAEDVFSASDATVVDTDTPRGLGGTGTSFDWRGAVPAIARVRGGRMLVLAGGLTPQNVAEAVRVLSPDVVDVSSGIESSVGVKDHALMAAFVAALGEGE
jgi:phosphoribosylanthranilate isomerase